jgi:iron complex outermembrane receptor protein
MVAALVVALLPASARAQVPTGVIVGVVRDASGIAVPGAVVRVINDATGGSVEAVSDGQGAYRAERVPGAYRVETGFDGFETVARHVTLAAGQTATIDLVLTPSRITEGVVVTARRVEEVAQEVSIPVSVVSGALVADAGAFNVNRLHELIPTVQFYSTNPRNTTLNIRGLGAPFGLTNDGIEPGVGLYIDGVFYARPAATTLDFIDVEQIEILRGPQGTLFGKNTTAGAIAVTTRRPSFTPETGLELTYGSLGFVQAKGSVSGPIGTRVAGRLSFSGTQRNGTLRNVATGSDVNDIDNLGIKGQLLITPSDRVAITIAADATRQRPDGHAQVIAGVAPTLRPADRQYAQIAADLGYEPPSFSAFDRLIDTDTSWRSNQGLGGASVNADYRIGAGVLTSTTAWRYWNWHPSNDRDFIGLPVTSVSAAPSTTRQWTQEVRYTGDLSPDLSVVVGGFLFGQKLESDPFHVQEHGAAAARFLLPPGALAATPGLLDGYGVNVDLILRALSSAVFGRVEWALTDRLRILPGLRVNYDRKNMTFDQQVYGGLQTTDPALIALQRSVLAPQTYQADVDDANVSGQMTAAYSVADTVNAYATFATSFKSVGLNLGGVPADAAGEPALGGATVKPERVRHVEVGLKTEPLPGVTANVAVYNTSIADFQTQVHNAAVGVLRGYLANAEKVSVRGVEIDANVRARAGLSFYGSAAYADGIYDSFPDAPPPLEETGGAGFKDVSGSVLPGISKWALAVGGEGSRPARLLGRSGQFFAAFDGSYRSSFSSNPSASKYLVVDGHGLLNARAGFRATNGWTIFFWTRNLLNENYFELLSPVSGGSGLYVGLPGDPRTFGLTLRLSLRSGS